MAAEQAAAEDSVAAKVEAMKIVNPVKGAIAAAKKEIKAAQMRNQKDVITAQKAAGVAAKISAKNGDAQAYAAAELTFHEASALAHLSLMEVYDAKAKLKDHEQTFDALQARMEAKKKTIVRKAVKNAKRRLSLNGRRKMRKVPPKRKS